MNRIDRLVAMITMLQSKKYVTAETIAEKFNTSVRTVYRDVKALCESGVPVSFEPNKGYFVVQGYFLPPVSFTTDEANALMLMEALAHGFADKSIHQHYTTALNKVRAGLRTTQKESVEALHDNIKMQLPPCIMPSFDYLSVIQNAITEKQQLVIEYKNKAEEISKRQVEPIGLIFYALSWHLIAWCNLRKEYRDFRVSRITSLRNLQITFTKQTHIELSEYMVQLPVAY